ncbi:TIGR02588 family protein [Sinorhizobium americanum]|uniref:Uncharacterized protein (TIGR02588 family) n=1 Tax=Sinorhizobium americanum TaxID=194963 RepID=A0A4R2C903_9HYPH|nr:TIGR02588 family protein [Sinorhizobium americanum]TCN36395.1 uncharacterized protein (TIGR02588 family) [Sinorhizobium americanum]
MTKNSAKGDRQKEQRDSETITRRPGTSTVEWIAAGTSSLALLAVLAYLVVEGLSEPKGTAQLVVLPVQVTSTNGSYVVEFAAENRAGRSVAAVEIQGELRKGDEVVEESSALLDYIPQQSERKGAVIFQRDPKAYELRLFARGYTDP